MKITNVVHIEDLAVSTPSHIKTSFMIYEKNTEGNSSSERMIKYGLQQ